MPTMNQQSLPIRLTASSELFSPITQGERLLSQLEAWLNFETMRANWYGDEEQVLSCLFSIMPQETYQEKIRETDNDPRWQQWQIHQSPDFMWLDLAQKLKLTVIIPVENSQIRQYVTSPEKLQLNLKKQLLAVVNQLASNKELPLLSVSASISG